MTTFLDAVANIVLPRNLQRLVRISLLLACAPGLMLAGCGKDQWLATGAGAGSRSTGVVVVFGVAVSTLLSLFVVTALLSDRRPTATSTG